MMSSATTSSMRGLGLIELMIALALGLIILLGITEIATRNSITRNELQTTGRQIDSAAYAIQVIETDITSAGFWGESGEQAPSATLPPLCAGEGSDLATARSELQDTLGYPVQGQHPGVGTDCITPKAGTDFLAIRRASSCEVGITGCDAAGSQMELQVNSCFVPDDDSLPLPEDITFDPNSISNYFERDCSTTAPVYRFISRVYYVDPNDFLIRARLEGVGNTGYSQETLVEGVELLRFEYGMDTDGDGQVDGVITTPVGTEWNNVVMVRMSIVVRNLEPSAGFTDTKTYTIAGASYVPTGSLNNRRQVYTRTVSLRNVAGRREQQ